MRKIKDKKCELFNMLESAGEGVYGQGFHIYEHLNDDGVKEWRCDMGDLGSFIVYKYLGYEEYSPILDDWETIHKEWYSYFDLSEVYEGYPTLTIEEALDHLNKYLENRKVNC